MGFLQVKSFEKAKGEFNQLYKEKVTGTKNEGGFIVRSAHLRSYITEARMLCESMHQQDHSKSISFRKNSDRYVVDMNPYMCIIDNHLLMVKKLLKNEYLFENIQLNLSLGSLNEIFNNRFRFFLKYVEILAKELGMILKAHRSCLGGVGCNVRKL